jgi:hypothetical protein
MRGAEMPKKCKNIIYMKKQKIGEKKYIVIYRMYMCCMVKVKKGEKKAAKRGKKKK